jgi:hypothetical protein
MDRENKYEKRKEKRANYHTIDDDTIIHLKNYYKLEGHGELLQFVKDVVIVGDEDDY